MLFQTIQLQLKRGGIVTENQVLFFLVVKALILLCKSYAIAHQKQCFWRIKSMLLLCS